MQSWIYARQARLIGGMRMKSMVYALEELVREHEERLCSSERNGTRRAD